MKRTLLVLALAIFGCAGCRAIQSNCGQPCAEGCGGPCDQSCCEPGHVATMKYAPRAIECREGSGTGYGRGGNIEADCPGGNCCVFDRYRGSDCGPGYPNAVYDCSPCCSTDWGCNG
ncbi:MAG TPA: hypothetical protein VFW73_12475, partial [Lacipirellulaceae bacterium]|nr:hypothetical protein [Lacipirellulaceae bacterium]